MLLIHRPRNDDWSLPKGKLEVGEAAEAAALREVHEETGFHCQLGPELIRTRYRDRKGRPKQVRYWAMTPVTGLFVPNDEVVEIDWVRLDRAPRRLTARRDHDVVAALAGLVVPVG